ncbi:MAG: hypothetical protein QG646_954, partial [Euryarchaeota archaeon]|nr:hypothetical protein [Euryarchaeota archaeon]
MKKDDNIRLKNTLDTGYYPASCILYLVSCILYFF